MMFYLPLFLNDDDKNFPFHMAHTSRCIYVVSLCHKYRTYLVHQSVITTVSSHLQHVNICLTFYYTQSKLVKVYYRARKVT